MLSKREFKVLFLIHAADVDYEFHKSEQDFIIRNYGSLVFDKMFLYYTKLRKESFDYIKNNIERFFITQEERIEFKNEVFELILADNNYNEFEKAFMQFFREELLVV